MKNIVDQIYGIMRESIKKGTFSSYVKLPSIRKLSKQYNVSRSTVQKVIKKLETDKLVERFLRSGIFISKNKNLESKKTIKPQKPRDEEIGEMLIGEILRGDLKAGECVPLQKELVYKYKTSKATMRSVTDQLVKKGFIHRKGSSFIVGGESWATRFKPQRRVYLIGDEPILRNQYNSAQRRQFYEAFESELQKCGITSTDYINLRDNLELLNQVSDVSTAGFLLDPGIFVRANETNEKYVSDLEKILNTLGRLEFPVVVDNFNSIMFYHPEITFKNANNIYLLWRDNHKVGRKIGTYLASLGHKKIAYFAYGNASWLEWRFKDLEQTIKECFKEEADVKSFQSNAGYNHLNEPFESQRFSKNAGNLLSKMLNGYRFSGENPLEKSYDYFYKLIIEDKYKKNMRPYFETAIKSKEITAWVCSGTDMATVAAEFLKEKGIPVPEKISLMGTNNDEDIMSYGITSLDDQRTQAGYLAAHCILGDMPIRKNEQGYVEYDGRIIVRKTVRAV